MVVAPGVANRGSPSGEATYWLSVVTTGTCAPSDHNVRPFAGPASGRIPAPGFGSVSHLLKVTTGNVDAVEARKTTEYQDIPNSAHQESPTDSAEEP